MNQRMARILVIFLWTIPFTLILVTFTAFPGQGFLSKNCDVHNFLMELPFRAVYSSLILFPIALIIIIYVYFHILLWYKRDISKSTVSRQNIRAAKTTLLIMVPFMCLFCWPPGFLNGIICFLITVKNNNTVLKQNIPSVQNSVEK